MDPLIIVSSSSSDIRGISHHQSFLPSDFAISNRAVSPSMRCGVQNRLQSNVIVAIFIDEIVIAVIQIKNFCIQMDLNGRSFCECNPEGYSVDQATTQWPPSFSATSIALHSAPAHTRSHSAMVTV
jgi:hypothetical protein